MTQLSSAWAPSPPELDVPRPRGVELVDVSAAEPTVSTEAPAVDRVVAGNLVPRPLTTTDWLSVVISLVAAASATTTVAFAGTSLPLLTSVALVVAWPLCMALGGQFVRRPLPDTPARQARRTLSAGARLAVTGWLLPVVVTGVFGAAGQSAVGSTQALAYAVVGTIMLTVALLGALTVTRHRHRGDLVVVGSPAGASQSIHELSSSGHRVRAACLTSGGPQEADLHQLETPFEVGSQHVADMLREHRGAGLLLVPGPELTATEIRRLQWLAGSLGSEVYISTPLLDVAPDRTSAMSAGGLRVLHVAHPSLRGPARLAKSIIERVAAVAILVLASPLLLVVAMCIRRDSPGPALFRQTRIGRGGVPFTMLKFRSMRTTAEVERASLDSLDEADGVLFKIHDDPRITALGRWLRKYSVDELPQLWNVARGEMSLVGPRPALPEEVGRYAQDPQRRLAVKPGLTGLWQVSGRSDLDWTETVRLDLRYVDNWSLRLDAWIMLRTVRAVLGHHGAY